LSKPDLLQIDLTFAVNSYERVANTIISKYLKKSNSLAAIPETFQSTLLLIFVTNK